MKRIVILWLTSLCVLPAVNHAAQTAQARLVCLSLRVQKGSAVDSVGFRWTMDFTTLPVGINGELAPDFLDSGYTNSTFVEMYSELLDDYFSGPLVLDTPDLADTNGNGFADFFEVSQPVPSLPALGAYDIPGVGSGPFTATWYRDAGSAVGSCSYTIPAPAGFGNLSFYHLFELIEYTGELAYTPGSNTVSASLSLTNTNSMAVLMGPVAFAKSPTNRFNQLTLQSVLLTNASEQTFDLYESTVFLRRASFPTNYQGNVEFNDGDPNTFEDDYYTWILSIDDRNDADHDGIPDFSDDLSTVTPPRRPELALAVGPTNLLLTIKGDVGRLHQVLETTSLTQGNWLTNLSLVLTNDPQTVSIPLPATAPRYWRALAQ